MSTKGSWQRPRSAHISLEVKDLKYDLIFGSPELKEYARERLVELGEIEDEISTAESNSETINIASTSVTELPGPFEMGDTVIVTCDRKSGRHIVVDPHEKTDMVRIDGTPVGHYVMIRALVKNVPQGAMLGYQEDTLRKIA